MKNLKKGFFFFLLTGLRYIIIYLNFAYVIYGIYYTLYKSLIFKKKKSLFTSNKPLTGDCSDILANQFIKMILYYFS